MNVSWWIRIMINLLCTQKFSQWFMLGVSMFDPTHELDTGFCELEFGLYWFES